MLVTNMKNTIKFTFIIASLFSFSAHASMLVCPATITCNYEDGTCDQAKGWYINFFALGWPASTGTQSMALSAIYGVKASASNIDPYYKIKKTKIECYYLPGGIKLVAYVKQLVGENWSFDGFGKFRGVCANISDPTTCSGEN